MKNDSFIKSFLAIGTGSVINLLLGLLTTPIITRLVSPADYGEYSIFVTYAGIATIILCLGLDQSLVRFYYEQNTIVYKNKLLWQCIKLPILIYFAIVIVVNCFSLYSKIFNNTEYQMWLIFVLYVFVSILYRFSQLVVRLEFDSKTYSKLNIFNKLFYLIILFTFFILYKRYDSIILCFSSMCALTICFIISVFSKRNIWYVREKKKLSLIKMKELISYGWPYIITLGITSFFQAIDKISLSFFCDYETVGVYSSAMAIINIFAIIQTSFNALWAPMGVEHYKKNPEDKSFFQKGNQYITVIMFLLGVSLIFAKNMFVLLLGEKYRAASYVIPFLVFSPIMNTISETTVGGLVYKKKSKYQIIVALVACCTNIIGNVILIPIIGDKGAAISTGISYIVFMLARTYLANRFYYIDFKLKKLYIIIVVTSIYALYSTFTTFNLYSLVGYVINVLVIFILYKEVLKDMLKYMSNIKK